MLETLHKASFEEQLHTPFQLLENSPVVTLELIGVSGPGVQGEQESFSLSFRGALETPLNQGTQKIKHEQLGEFDLFLVPIARQAEGFEYEAVFNRFADGDNS